MQLIYLSKALMMIKSFKHFSVFREDKKKENETERKRVFIFLGKLFQI